MATETQKTKKSKKKIKLELHATIDPQDLRPEFRSKTALKKAIKAVLDTNYPQRGLVVRTTTEDY